MLSNLDTATMYQSIASGCMSLYQVKGNSVIITFSGFGGQEQKLSKVETVVYVECQRIGDSWLDVIRGKCCAWYPVSSNKPVAAVCSLA